MRHIKMQLQDREVKFDFKLSLGGFLDAEPYC